LSKEGFEVEVLELPDCDIPACGKKAGYDAKTKMGPWANLCEEHFQEHGVGLGLGKGQKLILLGGKDMAKDKSPKDAPKDAPKGKKGKTAEPLKVKVLFEFVMSVNGLSIKEVERRSNYVLKQFKPKSAEIKLASTKCTVAEIK